MRGGEGQAAVQAHQLPHHAAEGRAQQLRGKGAENGARQQVQSQPRLLALGIKLLQYMSFTLYV